MTALYTKSESKQLQGLAVCAIICIHLFYRKDADVFGTPLLWIKEGLPLVCWLGWLSNICVPLYSLSAGYAQQLMDEKNGGDYLGNLRRCLRLMVNLWIVLTVFTILSMFWGKRSDMPTTFIEFVLQAFLVHFSNPAWWYMRTYVLIMILLPPCVLLWPIRRIPWKAGVVLCLFAASAGFCLKRFHFLPPAIDKSFVVDFVFRGLSIYKVLPFIWLGAIVKKANLFERCKKKLERFGTPLNQNFFLTFVLLISSLFVCLIENTLVIFPFAFMVFLAFPLFAKPVFLQQILSFLGKHSTNIWLIHMYFYARLYSGLVQKLQYPVFMFVGIMFLSIVSSYGIMAIQKGLAKSCEFVLKKN